MITLDSGSPTPPSEQLRAQIADQIRSGELAPATRLPSVRQLAKDLGVATGTVAKAYAALDHAGLVTTSRARGTRVAEGRSVDDHVRRAAQVFVRSLKPGRVTLDDALSAVRREWVAAHDPR